MVWCHLQKTQKLCHTSLGIVQNSMVKPHAPIFQTSGVYKVTSNSNTTGATKIQNVFIFQPFWGLQLPFRIRTFIESFSLRGENTEDLWYLSNIYLAHLQAIFVTIMQVF